MEGGGDQGLEKRQSAFSSEHGEQLSAARSPREDIKHLRDTPLQRGDMGRPPHGRFAPGPLHIPPSLPIFSRQKKRGEGGHIALVQKHLSSCCFGARSFRERPGPGCEHCRAASSPSSAFHRAPGQPLCPGSAHPALALHENREEAFSKNAVIRLLLSSLDISHGVKQKWGVLDTFHQAQGEK